MSIGTVLAEARERAGLTVADVSIRTRIRQSIIRSIEADDFSACGGDFYARGHIRSVAKAAGVDPEPLIREYDDAYRATGPLSAVSLDELLTARRPARARRGNRPLGLAFGLVVLVTLGWVVYHFLLSPGPANPAAPAAASHPAAQRHQGGQASASATPASSPSASSVRGSTASPSPGATAHRPAAAGGTIRLAPDHAAAVGAGGGQGDNAQLARLAIDGKRSTGWHTDWYTSARFGNLYPGTGLLLDMGRRVALTGARVRLGIPGATLQIRVGDSPALASLPQVARAVHARGQVRARFASPVHGRYVLLWFTRLPPDSSGTYQASVNEVVLTGQR